MAEPMTDADIERLRTMPFTTSLNVGCGVYATDEERHLHRLAAENHNAKLQVIAELVRVRAENDELAKDCEDCAAREESHQGTRWSLGTEINISEQRERELIEARAEIDRLRAELAEARKPKPPSMADAFQMFRDRVLAEEADGA